MRFENAELRLLREEARKKKIPLPTGLTALKSVGKWWLVESDGGFSMEVCAQSALEARCKVIQHLINLAERPTRNNKPPA